MNSIWVVIAAILFSAGIGWLYTALDDKTTLKDDIVSYQEPARGTAIAGQNLTRTVNDDSWSMWDIPLLGPVLSIIIGFLNLVWTLSMTFLTGLNSLLVLPTYLPAFMQTFLNWIEIGIVSILVIKWLHGSN